MTPLPPEVLTRVARALVNEVRSTSYEPRVTAVVGTILRRHFIDTHTATAVQQGTRCTEKKYKRTLLLFTAVRLQQYLTS